MAVGFMVISTAGSRIVLGLVLFLTALDGPLAGWARAGSPEAADNVERARRHFLVGKPSRPRITPRPFASSKPATRSSRVRASSSTWGTRCVAWGTSDGRWSCTRASSPPIPPRESAGPRPGWWPSSGASCPKMPPPPLRLKRHRWRRGHRHFRRPPGPGRGRWRCLSSPRRARQRLRCRWSRSRPPARPHPAQVRGRGRGHSIVGGGSGPARGAWPPGWPPRY